MERHLFPTEKQLRNAWTTCSETNKPGVEVLPLDDHRLQVHKVSPLTSHHLVLPPSGIGSAAPKAVWEAFYPKGSINPKNSIPGGFGFYLSGPPGFQACLRTANEVLFSYSVMFDKEWDFVKGGKLPGIFGGEGDSAYGCTGGRKDERYRCFSLRLMWRLVVVITSRKDKEFTYVMNRQGGSGEVYTYMPEFEKNTEVLLAAPPKSYGNYQYGFSVGRGAFKFPRGRWITVAERVKLNDPGEENGELELFVDGKTVISVEGLIYRVNTASKVQGVHFETFFGGHTEDWASPKDQRAWFSNVSGAILG
ncbi:hypothetical protein BDM02DRAFT_3189281 [Thelephora ganbajun]|uniref:Uncharacterized protein n=1 Tax=Thelephora ganbajun TaxID=370292 RepID=A0ACB6Z9A0_THEGA|nr:hypothetical protein BDM02DRAFT_3189281 [Thelephora ganbajun]